MRIRKHDSIYQYFKVVDNETKCSTGSPFVRCRISEFKNNFTTNCFDMYIDLLEENLESIKKYYDLLNKI